MWSSDLTNNDVLAQRLGTGGTMLWNPSGVAIAAASDQQAFPQIIPDDNSGAIICWSDWRHDAADIYANRVSNDGTILWATDGLPVCEALNVQTNPQLVSDGAGGAVLVWQDSRNVQFQPDVYAQRMNANGDTLWEANGVAVSTAVDWQWIPHVIPSGAGAAIVTWQDDRPAGSENHVYAQAIGPNGELGVIVTGVSTKPPPPPGFLRNTPNPFSSSTVIEYEVLHDRLPVTLTIYDARGRRVARLGGAVQTPGRHTIAWNGLDEHGRKLASGIYFCNIRTGQASETRKIVLIR